MWRFVTKFVRGWAGLLVSSSVMSPSSLVDKISVVRGEIYGNWIVLEDLSLGRWGELRESFYEVSAQNNIPKQHILGWHVPNSSAPRRWSYLAVYMRSWTGLSGNEVQQVTWLGLVLCLEDSIQRPWALKLDAPGKLGVKGGKSIVFKPLKASAEYFSRLSSTSFQCSVP